MFLSNLLDSPTPTIFELSMATNLSKGLKPAVEFLLRTLAERMPAAFSIFRRKRHYLAVYEGSFEENFYALKRVKWDAALQRTVPLSSRDKATSLFALALAPYLRAKLSALHERVAQEDAAAEAGASEAARARAQRTPLERAARRAMLRGLPMAFASYEAWSFALKVLFMFDKTQHFSPLDWLQGIVIARTTGDDVRQQMLRQEKADRARGLLGKLVQKGFGLLRLALIASALAFKLVEWYYSPENQSQRESAPALIPPPPMPPKPLPGSMRLLQDPRLCPLCHEPRTNPAISSSGLAFCFRCITTFVANHGRCPVTGTPCVPAQVRRIFVE